MGFELLGHAVEIAAATLAIIGTVYTVVRAVVRRVFRGIIRSKDHEIDDLKKDLKHRKDSLERERAGRQAAEARASDLEGRLAETALADAQKWWKDDNYNRGNRALTEWFEREGDTISKLLLCRASGAWPKPNSPSSSASALPGRWPDQVESPRCA